MSAFQGTKIHCTVPRMLVEEFIQKLKEGSVVQIHYFFVRNNFARYITTDHAYRIVFFQKTKVAELQVDGFPNHRFTFKPYTEIAAIQNIEDTPLFGKYLVWFYKFQSLIKYNMQNFIFEQISLVLLLEEDTSRIKIMQR